GAARRAEKRKRAVDDEIARLIYAGLHENGPARLDTRAERGLERRRHVAALAAEAMIGGVDGGGERGVEGHGADFLSFGGGGMLRHNAAIVTFAAMGHTDRNDTRTGPSPWHRLCLRSATSA